MSTGGTDESGREGLHDVVAEYLEAAETGRAPDRQQLLARHPEYAAELAEFFAAHDRLGALVPPHGPDDATPPAPSHEGADAAALLGQLGDFRILREVGRGGMGLVYEAEQLSLNRRVALKVLPFASALDPRQLRRFQNEAQAAAHLHHQ